MTENDLPQDYDFGDARDEIRRRAIAAGMKFTLEYWGTGDDDPDPYILLLQLPNGRETRTLSIGADEASAIASVQFEEFVVIGDYRAICNKEDQSIEALLRTATGPRPLARPFVDLPGSEIRRRDPDTGIVGDVVGGVSDLRAELKLAPDVSVWRLLSGDTSEYTWRLPIANAPRDHQVEISPASPNMQAFLSPDPATTRPGRRPTLKISGVKYENHDAALALLDDFAGSILFDLDLRFDLPLFLERRDRTALLRSRTRDYTGMQPLTFPPVRYSSPATTLYFYSKASRSMPLLQYLAFYQAIEFFFPTFFEQELISRVRNQMRDPRFNLTSDEMVKKVIGLAKQGGQGPTSEREQLRATLAASLDEDDLRKFLEESPETSAFISDKGKLKGVPVINFNSPAKLVDQLTERLYAIRCRIVHAKDSGPQLHPDPLLPYSKEAARLSHDLRIVEYACQKVIIAGAVDRPI